MSNTGIKYDSGKPPMDLLPREALVAAAEVLGFGAQKYGRYNWRGGMDWSRLVAAAMRHLTAWNAGESTDAETGMSHIAHAMVDLMMLATYERAKIGTDDRHVKPPSPGSWDEAKSRARAQLTTEALVHDLAMTKEEAAQEIERARIEGEKAQIAKKLREMEEAGTWLRCLTPGCPMYTRSGACAPCRQSRGK